MDFNTTHPLRYLLGVEHQYVPEWSPAIDPRTISLPLVGNYWLTGAILVGYFLFTYLGQLWMENRVPWKLGRVMQVYNATLAILSLYMATELFLSGLANGLSFLCAPVSFGHSAEELRLGRAIWLYYFSKVVELLDTVFMVLRTKRSQITFLHVYHHSSIVVFWWIAVAYVPGGITFCLPISNCVVHVFMYSYYFLASLGASVRRYLWWKRYLTKLQIGQFVLLVAQCLLLYASDCGYSRRFSVAVGLYMVSFLLLFIMFYNTTYRTRSKDN